MTELPTFTIRSMVEFCNSAVFRWLDEVRDPDEDSPDYNEFWWGIDHSYSWLASATAEQFLRLFQNLPRLDLHAADACVRAVRAVCPEVDPFEFWERHTGDMFPVSAQVRGFFGHAAMLLVSEDWEEHPRSFELWPV